MVNLSITVVSALLLVLPVAFAAVPSYIKVCGTRNPNLNQCLNQSVIELRPRLRVGMPELDVPSLEPMSIAEIALVDLEDFHTVATDVKLGGLSNFNIQYLRLDLEKRKVDITLTFANVSLIANYHVKAKIIVPINETGPIHILTENVGGKAQLMFEHVDRRGRRKIYFSKINLKIKIHDYVAVFQPGEKNPVTMAVNSVLQNNRPEIIENVTPSLEKDISRIILDLANQICKHFYYDEIFPDRE